MQFHDYKTIRNQFIALNDPDHPTPQKYRDQAKQMTSQEFRQIWRDTIKHPLKNDVDVQIHNAALAEEMWFDDERPFYDVWPIAIELAKDVTLKLPFSAVAIPCETMLLRFPRGHEPNGVNVALIHWPNDDSVVVITSYTGRHWDRFTVQYDYEPDEFVQEWLIYGHGLNQDPEDRELGGLLIRLCVFIGLLSGDSDMITPIVLSKDRSRYESEDDPDVKKWLEDRAARKMGRGFDVGKNLELEREKSPHWRNPHLALFWTGPGRTKPIIKMRSGAIVQRVSMAEVPTGYLGPETEEEDQFFDSQSQRIDVPTGLRFDIFKRDEYRCRICGRSAKEDGVKLHVDHIVPDAKGGTIDRDNLQTLCQDCNLGKSDKNM